MESKDIHREDGRNLNSGIYEDQSTLGCDDQNTWDVRISLQ